MDSKINKLSDAELLERCKENEQLLKELERRFPESILLNLEINKLLNYIGKKRIKDFLKESK